jgi:hypothetical protein
MRFLYLTSDSVLEQLGSKPNARKMRFAHRRCYHHNEVRPQTIGRVLGTGLRVGARIAGQRMAASAQNATTAPTPQAVADTGVRGRASGQVAGRATAGLARGVGGFLRPFRRVGGILWLEVTGVFFFLPVIVFAPTLWRVRADYAQGPDHRTFLVAAAVIVVFFYLGVTSFWRARRK